MKLTLSSLLLLLLSATAPSNLVSGQGTNGRVVDPETTDLSQIDPNFITYPDDGIDYPGCMSDLVTADRNRDGVVKQNEYLDFIQTYGKRICHATDRLSLKQRAAFIALACRCQGLEGYPDNCCVGNNARILTDGALDPKRTMEQKSYLVAVCRVTDGTIEEPRGCPPVIIDPDVPPPFVITSPKGQLASVAAPPPADGLSPGEIAGIVLGVLAALLLLMLCCCCCVFRKKRPIVAEEDELAKQTDIDEDVEAIPEQSPRGAGGPAAVPQDKDMENVEVDEYGNPVIPPLPPGAGPRGFTPANPEDQPGSSPPAVIAPLMAAAMPPAEDEEEVRAGKGRGGIDEYEEDVEAARGSGMIDDEEDEEDVIKALGSANIPPEEAAYRRKLVASGQLPPEDEFNENIRLRPPPPKEEEEDPDWDQPGRHIDEFRPKNEDEAQILDPYIPDGGVHIPTRPEKEPLDWKSKWDKPDVEDPDEHDNRKHRIQAGLGEGEVWNKLGEADDEQSKTEGGGGDAFDWVVQSALGVLSNADEEQNNNNQ